MVCALGAAGIHPGPLEWDDALNGKDLNAAFQHLYPQALVYSWSEQIQIAPLLPQILWHDLEPCGAVEIGLHIFLGLVISI